LARLERWQDCLGKGRQVMHTYEFVCDACSTKVTMEIHKELDYNFHCPCGLKMTLVFYLKSPDVRANN
jgi:DNA-directed RNA polymerase subunit RPC12/RpoP